MKRYTIFTFMLFFAWTLVPFTMAQHNQSNRNSRTIVDVAANAGSFNTLIAAVKAAGLESTLRSAGPFTVFAPTDAAFAKLPEGTIQTLLQPENKQKLIDILTYHVVSGKIRSTDLLNVAQAKTVNGKNVAIGLRVQNANIISTDIDASNGIIHVIDAVLLPPDMMNTSQNRHNNNRNQPVQNTDSYRTAQLEQAQSKWDNYRRTEYNNWQEEQARTGYQRAKNKITRSIEQGSARYNRGDANGCATIYMQTAETLMRSEPLPTEIRTDLETALASAQETHTAQDRAWIMRRALDKTYRDLGR